MHYFHCLISPKNGQHLSGSCQSIWGPWHTGKRSYSVGTSHWLTLPPAETLDIILGWSWWRKGVQTWCLVSVECPLNIIYTHQTPKTTKQTCANVIMGSFSCDTTDILCSLTPTVRQHSSMVSGPVIKVIASMQSHSLIDIISCSIYPSPLSGICCIRLLLLWVIWKIFQSMQLNPSC